MKRIWLASYPKSGNTWFRLLLQALTATAAAPFDINRLSQDEPIASSREMFDDLTLLDSGILKFAEVDALRPAVHRHQAVLAKEDRPRFIKVHDAYRYNGAGEAILAGAEGAVVLVRDPRDIAISWAHHNAIAVDTAITQMNEARFALCARPGRQESQLHQILFSWSGHITSWLDQSDIPVHLLRYEDLHADTAARFAAALDFAGYSTSPQAIANAVETTRFSHLQALEAEHGFAGAPDRTHRRAFFRKGETAGWKRALTQTQIAAIERAHSGVMRRLGYDLTTPLRRMS